MVTASVARELDVYRDCSSRVLDGNDGPGSRFPIDVLRAIGLSAQLLDHLLGFTEVDGLEPLCEPVVHRFEDALESTVGPSCARPGIATA